MNCVCLRLTNTYGPRQQLKGNTQGFTGIFIRKAVLGEKVSIFGDGKQQRDFNYVDDVVNALLLAVKHLKVCCGNTYNLGGNEIFSLLDFTSILHRLCEFESEIISFPPEHEAIDIGDYYSDYSLFHSITGWEPKINLQEGLVLCQISILG
ncbi:MAG: NAD-dependent epimerase/dehydratase family protein [FCB group bacterium]|nr:NAD-dependent epimerase/dehydratase family protein [FCB group bacterium]